MLVPNYVIEFLRAKNVCNTNETTRLMRSLNTFIVLLHAYFIYFALHTINDVNAHTNESNESYEDRIKATRKKNLMEMVMQRRKRVSERDRMSGKQTQAVQNRSFI